MMSTTHIAVGIVLASAAMGSMARASDENATTVSATRGPVTITATMSPKSPFAGEHITLTIDVHAAAGVHVQTPLITPTDGMIGHFNVLADEQLPDLPHADGGRHFGQRFTLDTFQTGDILLPALDVHFSDERGEMPIAGSVAVPSIDLMVQSSLEPGEADLRPMHGFHDVQAEMVFSWWWMLVPVGLAGGALGLWFWMRRGSVAAAIVLTPAQQARRELARVEAQGLLERGATDEYFARVTDIVRRYLEARFGLHAPRATTAEFLRIAKSNDELDADHRAQLQHLLTLADLVKFARHEPPAEAPAQAMHTALAFVDDTDLPEPEFAGGAA
ncbi:MAG: hypothetical protein MK074_07485 [Phycisphaerales bacterium]|nr:hypothetical protein [Phycisphaerales bacterium]